MQNKETASGVPASSISIIFFLGLVSTLALVATLIVGMDYFYARVDQKVYERYLSVVDPRLTELHASEDALLETYGWVDKGEGVVRVPVERAKELVLEETGR